MGRYIAAAAPFVIMAVILAVLSACSTRPPERIDNACIMLEDRRDWWRAVERTEDRWGVSPGIQLAILKRESSFQANARPPRRRYLGFIPGPRPSSAYGYAQALDTTWQWYREDTGRRGADRDDFDDAVDFIGWYSNKSRELSGISLNDARNLYLAYHDGHAGFNRGTYRGNAWLLRTADSVARDAALYDAQIAGCRDELSRRRFLFF